MTKNVLKSYIEKSLQDHMVPLASFTSDNFVVMNDNAKPPFAKIVTRYHNNVPPEIPSSILSRGWALPCLSGKMGSS